MSKKSFIAIVLVLSISLSLFTLPTSAENAPSASYTVEQTLHIFNTYSANKDVVENTICTPSALGYWSIAEQDKEKNVRSWLIDIASDIIEQKPDKKKYTEILTNLITMQESNLAEQIENQSQFDDLKSAGDYAGDIIGLATTVFGVSGSDIVENISTIVDTVADGVEILTSENDENFKYYLASIESYAHMDQFLKAVEKHSEISEMKEAATDLRAVCKSLFTERLEYIGNNAAAIVEYEANFFKENLFFELIKQSDTYKTDEATQWFVNSAEGFTKTIVPLGKFTFEAMMLIGDIGFGTSDTFNRYQEMKACGDVASSISKAIKETTVSGSDLNRAIDDIGKKCDYYTSMLATHARGEYLVRSLLVEDAGLLSQFRVLSELFKDQDKTTDAWYKRQTDCIKRFSDDIKKIFDTPQVNSSPEKPTLSIFEKNGAEYFNYHCKIEKESLPTLSKDDIYLEPAFELVCEFDVKEKKDITLDDLVEQNGVPTTYRITISDLSDKPGTTQEKYVTVSKSGEASELKKLLLENYWERSIQCYEAFSFNADGTGMVYVLDCRPDDKTGFYHQLRKEHNDDDSIYKDPFTYKIDNEGILTISETDANGNTHTRTLKYIDINANVEIDQSLHLPTDEKFFYNTDWKPAAEGEFYENADYLSDSKMKNKTNNNIDFYTDYKTNIAWHEAYINILKNTKDATYSLYDINKDGIPELILTYLSPISSIYKYINEYQIYGFSHDKIIDYGKFSSFSSLYKYDGNGLIISSSSAPHDGSTFFSGEGGWFDYNVLYISNDALLKREIPYASGRHASSIFNIEEEYLCENKRISRDEFQNIAIELNKNHIHFFGLDELNFISSYPEFLY